MKLAQRTLLFVLAATVTACSNDEPPPIAEHGEAATETPAAPSTDAEASPAESPAPTPAPIDATSPVGSWTLDPNASLEHNVAALMAGAESVTPEQEKKLRDQVALVIAFMQMDLVLAADNTLSGTSASPSLGGGAGTTTALTGTWSLVGDALTVSTRGVGTVEVETLTGRLDGAQLVLLMQPSDAPPLTLIFMRKS